MAKQPNQTRDGKIGQALFLLAGVLALVIGVWQSISTTRFVRHAVETTGRVLADRGDVEKGQSAGHPAIEFRTGSGALVRYTQNGMGARPVGSTMRVLYDPAAPADTAVVPAFWTLWFPAVGPLVMGVVLLLVAFSGAEFGLRGARP